MLGTKTTIASLLMATCAIAQENYLPLESGNQWVYRSDGPGSASVFTVAVKQSQTFNGRDYFLVEGLQEQSPLWLRRDQTGAVYMWDTKTNAESIWIDFAAQPPAIFKPGSDPCAAHAAVESREYQYTGPIGEFKTALSVKYAPGSCADAGLDRDVFLPSVGLVRRTSQTIAGPRNFDLIYARLGSTVVSGSESGFSLTLDQHVYTANLMPPVDRRRAVPTAVARLTLRNTGSVPLELEFTSGQRFDIVIYNSDGKDIYRWSADKMFITMLGRETITGEKNWVEAIPLGQGETPWPAGRYVAYAEITSQGKPFSATVTFEIRHVF